MRIAVLREYIAQRADEHLAHTYVPILEQYTFSTAVHVAAMCTIYL
jgi:hypothetical protein